MMDEIILEGGNLNTVIRIGNTVRRPLKTWSPHIHKLLLHLEAQGFSAIPSFLGIDDRDREILSFIPGETGVTFPKVKSYMLSDEVLVEVASMLRGFHDASASFGQQPSMEWMLSYPGNDPHEVMCHNDVAPYNVVFVNGKPTAIIDFDTACPGPRLWDIVYTLYTFVPLGRFVPDSKGQLLLYDPVIHVMDRKKRIVLFFEVYGMTLPTNVIEYLLLRLGELCNTLLTKARNGEPEFVKMVAGGHVEHYLSDIAFIKVHGKEWI